MRGLLDSSILLNTAILRKFLAICCILLVLTRNTFIFHQFIYINIVLYLLSVLWSTGRTAHTRCGVRDCRRAIATYIAHCIWLHISFGFHFISCNLVGCLLIVNFSFNRIREASEIINCFSCSWHSLFMSTSFNWRVMRYIMLSNIFLVFRFIPIFTFC